MYRRDVLMMSLVAAMSMLPGAALAQQPGQQRQPAANRRRKSR